MSEIKVGSLLVSKKDSYDHNEILLVVDRTKKNSSDDALGFECLCIKTSEGLYVSENQRWFHPLYAKSKEFKKAWIII